jgi:hypothetical protein
MASGWFFDLTSEKKTAEALMYGGPWIIVITGLLLILGCAESAAAQSDTYSIHTAITETGASTWNPSFVVIDIDELSSPPPLVFRVTNPRSEEYSFVIEALGIDEHIPAFGEVTIRTRITTPGVYQYYSDRHPRASAPDATRRTRPHVPGWLVVREATRAEASYLEPTRYFGRVLLEDLQVLQQESMYQRYLPAMVERCQQLLDHLEWATAQLWQFDQSGQHDSILSWMIHVLVREDTVPAFSRLRSPRHLDPVVADELLDQIIANVAGVERMLGFTRRQHASYS